MSLSRLVIFTLSVAVTADRGISKEEALSVTGNAKGAFVQRRQVQRHRGEPFEALSDSPPEPVPSEATSSRAEQAKDAKTKGSLKQNPGNPVEDAKVAALRDLQVETDDVLAGRDETARFHNILPSFDPATDHASDGEAKHVTVTQAARNKEASGAHVLWSLDSEKQPQKEERMQKEKSTSNSGLQGKPDSGDVDAKVAQEELRKLLQPASGQKKHLSSESAQKDAKDTNQKGNSNIKKMDDEDDEDMPPNFWEWQSGTDVPEGEMFGFNMFKNKEKDDAQKGEKSNLAPAAEKVEQQKDPSAARTDVVGSSRSLLTNVILDDQ